jgi:predicted Zn-dependent peptidase
VFREFYSERNVILEERRQTLESRPGGTVNEAFNAMTWMASPYHWEVIGWPSDISQVTREQANEFFATYYAPNNITAILVGDFNADAAFAMAEKYLGRIPKNPKGVPEVITLEPKQPAEQRMVAEVETTPSLQVAFKTVPSVHKDAPALQALAGILGGTPMFMGRPGGPGGGMRPHTGRLN